VNVKQRGTEPPGALFCVGRLLLSRARHKALLAAICEYDVDRWQREFLTALRGDDGVSDELRAPVPTTRNPESIYPGTTAARWNPTAKA
jgi:hypothetical protein